MDINEHLCACQCEIIIWSTASLVDRTRLCPSLSPHTSVLCSALSALPACSSVLFYLPVASCTVDFPPPVTSAPFG